MDCIKILNTIRANATDLYRDRVPEATLTNLADVGNPILEYEITANEFISTLINRIVKTLVINKRFTNPLAKFKGENLPFGYSIQNIYTNPVKGETFAVADEDIVTKTMKKSLPDTKVEYFSMNRQDTYPITISEDMLQTAFTSYENMSAFIDGIFNAMYSGDSIDEFSLMKSLFTAALEENQVVSVCIESDVDGEEVEFNATEFVKLIKNLGSLFKFPSADYNKYSSVKGNEETDLITWTEESDLLFLCESKILNDIDVDVLARAFNIDKVTFMGQVTEIDNFPTITNTTDGVKITPVAVLCDRHVIKAFDNKFKVTEFTNGRLLTTNYWLHHWETLSLSLMANCVVFFKVETIE